MQKTQWTQKLKRGLKNHLHQNNYKNQVTNTQIPQRLLEQAKKNL